MAKAVKFRSVSHIECLQGEFQAFELQGAFHGWVTI